MCTSVFQHPQLSLQRLALAKLPGPLCERRVVSLLNSNGESTYPPADGELVSREHEVVQSSLFSPPKLLSCGEFLNDNTTYLGYTFLLTIIFSGLNCSE